MNADHHDPLFDRTMIETTLQLAQDVGWQRVSLVDASREAELPLQRVRQRFPFKAMILLRLNQQIDDAALCGESYGTTVRERLFDLLMRRFDAMQDYRSGICAIMRTLPRDPALAAFLAGTTMESLRWIADAAMLNRQGLTGMVRLNALLALWSRALISWEKDDSPDLATTMQTLDGALARAERMGLLKEATTSSLSATPEGGLPDHIAPDEQTVVNHTAHEEPT
ncbi:TetR family transcriptional regulator [Bombella favorum]|uniref:TetR family transcriptional regulator n=1 Tax=Bombella favorum TaxID=2039164 RepID=A0ABR5ZPU2_9PROT|nr:TetR family transcriptional regulator [Bombella favorum]MBA5726255.1 TetR family transcriptional regulator [Bombella favorum]